MNRYDDQATDRLAGETSRTPEAIESDIQQTRDRMTGHLDELGDRFTPENLKRQAKEALSDTAQDVAANVQQQARDTGSKLMTFIGDYPLPVAAVSLGAIWLFSLRKDSGGPVSGDRMARFAYTGPERRIPNGRPELGRRLRDGVRDVASQAGEKASELGDKVQSRAGEVSEAAHEGVRQARGGFERTFHDNPLAVSAGAIVLGLALGMLLPETAPEREWMGEKRNELGEKVSKVADRLREAAVETGQELKEKVQDEVQSRTPEVKRALTDAAERVKSEVGQEFGSSSGSPASPTE